MSAGRLGPGMQLGPYRIEALAGRGGMGVVYLATDTRLERHVALKVIADELTADPEFRARFQREAKLAAVIDHPNVVPVYEAGEADDHVYMAMRWVDGASLADL